jgi:hypothetical protein
VCPALKKIRDTPALESPASATGNLSIYYA